MQGSLGEKIGEGVSSDVHVWAPGRVVKLFRPGVSRRLAGIRGPLNGLIVDG